MRPSLLSFAILCSSLLLVSCAGKQKKDVAAKDTAVTQAPMQGPEVQKEATEDSDISYACKVGKDLRIVKVKKTDKRCEVYYTKFGDSQQVAWAEATPSICSRVEDQIKNNIEAKGFKCSADISSIEKGQKSASTN